MVQLKNLFVLALLVSVASCSFFKKKHTQDADLIARVNEEYLYASDITSITKGLKGEDSINVLKNYADSWVRKKLLLQKASDNIAEEDFGITKKVEDYRQALLLYEYEKALINQKLDTTIRDTELNDMYEKLKSDFPLDNDVYQLYFIKVKRDAPDLDQARKWVLKPKDEEDARKLEGYCKEFASSYTLDKGMWYEQANVLKNFPLSQNDINALANSGAFKEFKTDEGSWFIKISAVAKKDEPAPLEFIREQIVKAIIEKRRLKVVEKVYDKIYQDGLQAKSVEVFVK